MRPGDVANANVTFAEIVAPDAVGVSALVTHACPSAGMTLAHGDLQAYSVNAEQGDPSHVPSEGLKLVCAVEEWMSRAEAGEQSACDAACVRARAHALAVWLSSAGAKTTQSVQHRHSPSS